jgi:hypothetical protein
LLGLLGAWLSGCKDTGGISIPEWIIGEMTIDPEQIPSSGDREAEVSVWVYQVVAEGGRMPLPSVDIQIHSSRNQGGITVDIIEQPTGLTDADGRAVAFLGSSTTGEAQIKATANGADLCELWENERCVVLQKIVSFISECQGDLTSCDGECVDLNTDNGNCGACGVACDFPNSTSECRDGACAITACDRDRADCDGDIATGCEVNTQTDPDHCGSCDNACPPGNGCVDGECYICDDLDNDDYCSVATGGDDCNDQDPAINPGATETCDGDDNNCDGNIDEDPEASADCDDGNDCTDESCDPASGCVYANNTANCEDGNLCTRGDVCSNGFCQPGSGALDCGDNEPCTDDSCDPALGCMNVANTLPCDDADACTIGDICASGTCRGGGPKDCSDGNDCTDDGCISADGTCTHTNNTAACDDGDVCTMNDTCGNGQCIGEMTDLDDDGWYPLACTGGFDCDDTDENINPGVFEGPWTDAICTDGVDNDCDGKTDALDEGCFDCGSDPNPDQLCNDGNVCNGAETCDVPSGNCLPGTHLNCDDGNPCTNDTCDDITGCVNTPNVNPCDDNERCTLNDTCAAGSCVGTAVVCTALDQCHDVGVCDPATGICSNPNMAAGTACDDGSSCTATDTCQAGVCMGADPVICTPLDPCHDAGTCNPTTGLCDDPAKADGAGCDDGDLCTLADTCLSGACIGYNPVMCTPLDQCHEAGVCDSGTGVCSDPPKADNTPCDDSDACTQADTCQAEVCTGVNPVVCTAMDQCHDVGTCDAGTGVCSNPNQPDDTPCDDGDACMQIDTCQLGICAGSNPVVCTAMDQCHDAGVCNPSTGNCSNPPKADGAACDDGDACSTLDTCQGGTCTAGTTDLDADSDTYLDDNCPGGNDCDDDVAAVNPGATEAQSLPASCGDSIDNDCDTFIDMLDSGCAVCSIDGDCDDSNECTTDVCSGGVCQNNAVGDGGACDDGDACTQTDTCQSGVCTGLNPVVCTALDQCHNIGGCNSSTGVCSSPQKPDDSPCDDGDACTQTDTCQSGSCIGADPVTCTASNQCHNAGNCIPATGLCTDPPKADDTPCDDGNACTQTDLCQVGVCTGADPVVCTALDQCHDVGVCNTFTGVCSNPTKPDDTPCDDGNACTQTDTCQGGSCQGTDPVVCTPLDQCHDAGVCNTTTGNCPNPEKTDDTPCDDGNDCSTQDTCQGGTCTAGPTDKDTDSDTYLDGLCSGGNDCDDSRGDINPGAIEDKDTGVTCSDTWDNDCDGDTDLDDTDCVDCTAHAQCVDSNPCTTDLCVGGFCQNNSVSDGTGCDDGDACTQTDECQSGTCTGLNPVECTASDQCHSAGICDSGSGLCSDPQKSDGSLCDDGDACTQTDTCQIGVCTGADPVVCTALDQCHDVGLCNISTGNCSNPSKPDDTLCDDGNACTQTDTCQLGTCTGADPVVCTALDQCHVVGGCNASTGNCSNPQKPDDTSCDDGNACTQTDTCQVGVCTGADPVVCVPLDQCHNAGTCNTGTGNCSDPNKPDDTPCDDSNACTQTDTCQSGVCTGVDPVVCTALDQCHDAGVCNTFTGNCSNPNQPDNTACNDGNLCSTLDTCQGGICTAGATNKDTDTDTYYDGLCLGGDDCNDNAPAVNPGVVEQSYGQPMCTDVIDNDCDGDTDIDDTGCMQCTGPGDCDDSNTCTTDDCVAGECQNTPVSDGTGCVDGDACTQTDTCQGGVCTGADPVVCAASDQCHLVGTCDSGTGLCSDPARPDDTPCDDGDACTQTDTCQSGGCTGADPVVCTASNQCHDAGNCDSGTGLCSDPPKVDGTPCDDYDLCSQTDTCQSGGCTGSNWVTCTALDQCHDVGVCQPATGNCTNPNKPNDTPCADGDACTQTDTCQSGNCVGVDPVVCTALDQCHDMGVCDSGTGLCSDPPKGDGSPCDDNNACTQTDTCQSGNCVGVDPVVCTALDSCHDVGVCDGGSGLCTDPPKSDGSACDDWEDCSHSDRCGGGVCAGTDYVCDDFMPCTNDSCNGDGSCTFTDIPSYWLEPDFAWVEYLPADCDGIDNDCDGCVDEGCAGYSEPIVAVEVLSYSSPDGLRRLSGNGQFGPAGKLLPTPLTVQVNNGADSPMRGEPVTFLVEPLTDGVDPEVPSAEGVCYGNNQTQYDCGDWTFDRLCPLDVKQVCNTVLGTLYDADGNPGAQIDVHTDDNGQARVWLMLPTDDLGMTVVSATANGDRVYFFAGVTYELDSGITVPTEGNEFPVANPAFGPLIQTRWPDSPPDFSQFDTYTLAITGLSTDNGTCLDGELPEIGLVGGGNLYICGQGFASSGNQVWVGGVSATVTNHSTTKLTVTLPEGIPGAASVKVHDGTTTICKNHEGHDDLGADNFGWLESTAVAAANLWRSSPKPIYVYSRTGSVNGSSAKVKLLGLDRCGNPLSLSGHTVSVDAYNPFTDIGGAASSSAVTIAGPDAAGIATVAANSSRDIRAAVIVGKITDLSLSSNDLVDGNATVSVVPRLAPGRFEDDPGIGDNGNTNGVNSILFRGADEQSTTELVSLNPAIRTYQDGIESTEVDTWSIPYGQTAFETEAHITGGTLTGEGTTGNLTTEMDFYNATAGTFLMVLSGGSMGMVAVFAATAGIDPDTDASGTTEILMAVPPVVMGGEAISPETAAGTQILQMAMDSLLFLDDNPTGFPRGMDVRIVVQRPLP